jgi:hypothetical protein
MFARRREPAKDAHAAVDPRRAEGDGSADRIPAAAPVISSKSGVARFTGFGLLVRFDAFACHNASHKARGPLRRHWTAGLQARKPKGFSFVEADHYGLPKRLGGPPQLT